REPVHPGRRRLHPGDHRRPAEEGRGARSGRGAQRRCRPLVAGLTPTAAATPRRVALPPAACLAHFGPGASEAGRTMALSQGQRVTLLKIDDCLAMTHRYELEVRSVLDPQAVGYEGRRQRVAIVRQRGKRKDFYLDLATDDILLDGWGLPFKTDTEAGRGKAGNACFNLIRHAP